MIDPDIDNLSRILSDIKLDEMSLTNQSSSQQTNQPSIDIKPLDLLPDFDGTAHKLYRFITLADETLDTYWDHNNVASLNNKFLLNAIISKLTGRAEEIVAVSGARTWPQIKDTLLTTFGDLRDENALLSDLVQTYQKPSEDTITYYYRVISTLNHLTNYINLYETIASVKINKINTYNSQALRTLIIGLKEPVQSMLRSQKPNNLAEALKYLTEDHNIRYMTKQHQQINSNNQYRQIPQKTMTQFTQPFQPRQFPGQYNFPRNPIQIQSRQPPQAQRYFTNAQVFGRPNNVNVWKPKGPNFNPTYQPTPMSVNTRNTSKPNMINPTNFNTRNMTNAQRPQFRQNYFQNQRPNFTVEEVNNVEENALVNYDYQSQYCYDNQNNSEYDNQYHETYYANYGSDPAEQIETNFDPTLFDSQTDEQTQNFQLDQPLIEET